jgi:hypothetical protein
MIAWTHRSIRRRLCVRQRASSEPRGMRAHRAVSDDTLASGAPGSISSKPPAKVQMRWVGWSRRSKDGSRPECSDARAPRQMKRGDSSHILIGVRRWSPRGHPFAGSRRHGWRCSARTCAKGVVRCGAGHQTTPRRSRWPHRADGPQGESEGPCRTAASSPSRICDQSRSHVDDHQRPPRVDPPGRRLRRPVQVP